MTRFVVWPVRVIMLALAVAMACVTGSSLDPASAQAAAVMHQLGSTYKYGGALQGVNHTHSNRDGWNAPSAVDRGVPTTTPHLIRRFFSGFAAETGAEDAAGIVYRRTDGAGGKPYIGQTKSDVRFEARQEEHARAHPQADFDYEILGRANPGTELDRLEEFFIRQEGGPTNLSNPDGLLANWRHQMNDARYQSAGGDYGP